MKLRQPLFSGRVLGCLGAKTCSFLPTSQGDPVARVKMKLWLSVLTLWSLVPDSIAVHAPVVSHSKTVFMEDREIPRTRRSTVGNPWLMRSEFPSKSQQEFLENEHNRYRSLVPAKNMRYMSWDDNVAWSAQRHANTCNFHHSKGRKNTGENIWAAPFSNYDNAVQLWFDEIYDPHCHCQNVYKHCCGHYTQVVWAESHRFGCGFAHCRNIHGAHGHRYILVCQYTPSGNILFLTGGKLLYLNAFQFHNSTHKSCSDCPKNAQRCWKGLCY